MRYEVCYNEVHIKGGDTDFETKIIEAENEDELLDLISQDDEINELMDYRELGVLND